jgi:hypothetical protein
MKLREAAKQAPKRQPKPKPGKGRLRKPEKTPGQQAWNDIHKALGNYTHAETPEVKRYLRTFLELPNVELAKRVWKNYGWLIGKYPSPEKRKLLLQELQQGGKS